MGRDDPFACLIACGEQGRVADLHRLRRAGQAEGGEDFGHGHGGIAREDVFQRVIGKFHGVEGEALRLYHGGGFILGRHVQLLGRAALVDVVDAGLQVLVGDLRQGKGHADGLSLGGLELLTGGGVDHLDVEGVGNGHVLVFVAHLLHGGVRLPLFVHRHALHGELRALGEHTGLGLDGDDHAVHGPGLVKGHGLRNSLQRKGQQQRLLVARYGEGHVFKGNIALRLGGIGVFAGEQRKGAVRLRGDSFGGRDLLRGGGPDRHHSRIGHGVEYHADGLEGFALRFCGVFYGDFFFCDFVGGLLGLFLYGGFAFGCGFALGSFFFGGFAGGLLWLGGLFLIFFGNYSFRGNDLFRHGALRRATFP